MTFTDINHPNGLLCGIFIKGKYKRMEYLAFKKTDQDTPTINTEVKGNDS